jgi:ribosomal protein S18 acetylase RimI-like enzyme
VNDNRVTAADVRTCMRGEVYGDAETMTDAWFADHVARNDIDLARSPRWTVDSALVAFALLAFRGDRAWIGGFGVVPGSRGAGMGTVCVLDTLRIAREENATSVELEVLENNGAAIAIYQRGGFEQVDELVAWRREPHIAGTDALGMLSDAPRDTAAVAAIARHPATCWQREPRSVAMAAPFVTVTVGDERAPSAYAFVRLGGPRGTVLLDAGAHDEPSAQALVASLDAQLAPHDLTLINEPSSGPLDLALFSNPFWDPIARQRRMRVQLR